MSEPISWISTATIGVLAASLAAAHVRMLLAWHRSGLACSSLPHSRVARLACSIAGVGAGGAMLAWISLHLQSPWVLAMGLAALDIWTWQLATEVGSIARQAEKAGNQLDSQEGESESAIQARIIDALKEELSGRSRQLVELRSTLETLKSDPSMCIGTADTLPASKAPLDWAALVARCEGDSQQAGEALIHFRDRCARLTQAMAGAAGANDPTCARLSAHELKGAASRVAAHDLAAAAARLDDIGSSEFATQVERLVIDVRAEVDRLFSYLNTLSAEDCQRLTESDSVGRDESDVTAPMAVISNRGDRTASSEGVATGSSGLKAGCAEEVLLLSRLLNRRRLKEVA